MSHEKEHVANAVSEGNKDNKELVNVSVSLKTSVCPECGRVYVSGGTTNSTMRTTSESPKNNNPYQSGLFDERGKEYGYQRVITN